MELDVEELKQAGADGLVFGALLPGGQVDIAATSRLVHLARPYVALMLARTKQNLTAYIRYYYTAGYPSRFTAQ